MKGSIAAALAAILSALAAPAAAQPAEKNPVGIAEWEVPYPESRPRDPDVVSKDTVWFVGQKDNYIARFNPRTEAFTRTDLPEGTGPHNLIVASNGDVWFAGNRDAYIGRYDPETGEIERIAMPQAQARDPHTLVFDAGEEHIFFTVQGGNFVGRLTLETREVTLTEVPTSRARPYGIKIAPDGTVWVALFGSYKLAEIDPETMALSEHPLPNRDARPRRIGILDTGEIYYTDYARGRLGHFDPESGAVEEWAMPSGESGRPYGMAIDSQNRVWYVATGPAPNPFVGFDPEGERFFSISHVPSGAGAIRHMDYHPATGTIWFGTDANTVGRAKVEPE